MGGITGIRGKKRMGGGEGIGAGMGGGGIFIWIEGYGLELGARQRRYCSIW